MPDRIGVLFVCTGNICRSPTAEGVLRQRLHQGGLDGLIHTDSAGAHGYHVGEPPDARACTHARLRGIDIGDLRARQVEPADFERFDLILAMDRGHLTRLARIGPPGARGRLHLFTDFAPPPHRGQDVPDPYYGGAQGFESVLDLVECGVDGLVRDLRRRLDRPA